MDIVILKMLLHLQQSTEDSDETSTLNMILYMFIVVKKKVEKTKFLSIRIFLQPHIVNLIVYTIPWKLIHVQSDTSRNWELSFFLRFLLYTYELF